MDLSRRDFIKKLKDIGLGLTVVGVMPKTLDTLWEQGPIVLEGELLDMWVSANGPMSGSAMFLPGEYDPDAVHGAPALARGPTADADDYLVEDDWAVQHGAAVVPDLNEDALAELAEMAALQPGQARFDEKGLTMNLDWPEEG